MGESPYCRYYDRIIPKSRRKVKESNKKDRPPQSTFFWPAVYAENSREQDGSAIFVDMWKLSDLPVGTTAAVEKILMRGAIRLRLMELGLVPGTRVRCVHRAPSGSPAAYAVRGAVIAIRRSDAGKIRMEPWA